MEYLPVELSVVDRLEEVVVFDLGFVLKVGDGASDAEDLVVSPGGKAHFIDIILHQVHALFIEPAVFAEEFAGHLRVVEDPHPAEAISLVFAGSKNLRANCIAGGAGGR